MTLAVAMIPATPAIASPNNPNGGTGLGSGTTTSAKSKKKKKSEKQTTAKADADPTTVLNSNPVLAPVKQDGGSQHLGERTLRAGMHGHDVRVLQGYLTMDGFSTSVDGAFGPTTKRDVIQFEDANELKANGIVTYAQSVVLRQDVAKAMTTTSPVAGSKVTINSDGTASAPVGAPLVVQKVVAAANQIIDTSYCYAGGHGSWNSSCYDCSGSVSFALHGGGLLNSPEDSTGLESYGDAGPGKWITIYADSAHTFIVVGGRAFDTADYGGPNIPSGTGPRWRTNPTGNLQDGGDYVVRHPAGL